MKKILVLLVLISVAFTSVMAQSRGGTQSGGASSIKAPSFNGTTGLYSIPTGYIGWEGSNNLALDIGYRAIIGDRGISHIPSLTLSLFKFVEISSAFDIQTRPDDNDLLFGAKIRLPTRTTAIALGMNMHLLRMNRNNGNTTFQPYIAITYPGSFFSMPAETTLVIGKTFFSNSNSIDSNIDFGMGFDIVLLPDVFNNILHLILDFSNFAYSYNAFPGGSGAAAHRGVFNAGFRLDLSQLPPFRKYKFIVDFAFNDILDDGSRAFTAGAVFGIPFM